MCKHSALLALLKRFVQTFCTAGALEEIRAKILHYWLVSPSQLQICVQLNEAFTEGRETRIPVKIKHMISSCSTSLTKKKK
jgi:hypothetical protein